MSTTPRQDLDLNKGYEEKYGFSMPERKVYDTGRGLTEDVVRQISAIKGEPDWMTEWRLKAYRHWLTMSEPRWPNVSYPEIDYQAISYFSAPKKKTLASLDEVDPEILWTYEKLGIPLAERAALAGVAVDAVFDGVSVATTFKDKLAELGINLTMGSFGSADTIRVGDALAGGRGFDAMSFPCSVSM